MRSDRFISKLLGLLEEDAARIVRHARFGFDLENLRCPYCGSVSIVKFGYKSNKVGVRRYKCMGCGKVFNDLTGTPLNGSKLSLREWIVLAYLYFVREEPIFSIARILGRPYPTVWNAVSRLKRMNGFIPHIASILAMLEFQYVADKNEL